MKLPVWHVKGVLVYNESGEEFMYSEYVSAIDKREATTPLYLHELRGYSVKTGSVRATLCD